jgi:hypothetical protein
MDLLTRATTYCDINDITVPRTLAYLLPTISEPLYTHCVARCTLDFFAYGLWQLAHDHIDDEQFFVIGDISSTTPLKLPRPHLDALQQIDTSMQPQTLYIIDSAAEIAYIHLGNSIDELHTRLRTIDSTYICL